MFLVLHASRLCEHCQELRWLRAINQTATLSPMKLGACWVLAMIFRKLFPWLRLTDMARFCLWRPSDKLIWEDAERGLNCSLAFVYSLAHDWASYPSSRPHVCPKAVILIHLARFCEWCSGQATASHGKSILWLFWLGSGPVFCGVLFGFAVCFGSPLAKRKSGWGICGSLCWWVFAFVWFIDLPTPLDMIVLCTNIFSAYAHVRTEPSARHRPHSRKKKQTKNKPKNRIGTRTEKASGGQQQQDGGRPGRQQG